MIDSGITYYYLIRLSLSSILQNAATPAATTLQTAMLGVRSTKMLAAFAMVEQINRMGYIVFNFLVDGVTAKVGLAVGARDAAQVAVQVKLAVATSIMCGVFAVGILTPLKETLFEVYGASGDVKDVAKHYFELRMIALPMQICGNTACGILAGFGRIHIGTGVMTFRALLDISGCLVVILMLRADLWELGIAQLLAQTVSMVVGTACVFIFAPIGLPRVQVRDILRLTGLHFDKDTWGFLYDGLSMCIRTTLLQGTFFISLIAASHISTSTIAAQQIMTQMWTLGSYLCDGFAYAGTMLGSQMTGHGLAALPAIRRLFHRLLLMGLCTGVVLGAVLYNVRLEVVSIFTNDHHAKSYLHAVWVILCIAQPLNALVFVYDGLLYAAQGFAHARELMEVGVGLIFGPALVHAYFTMDEPRWVLHGIWVAKLALNLWRLVALSTYIHLWFLRGHSMPESPSVTSSPVTDFDVDPSAPSTAEALGLKPRRLSGSYADRLPGPSPTLPGHAEAHSSFPSRPERGSEEGLREPLVGGWE